MATGTLRSPGGVLVIGHEEFFMMDVVLPGKA